MEPSTSGQWALAAAFWVVTGILVAAAVFGAFTSYVAAEKGYKRSLWFFFGAVFVGVALLAAVGLPDSKSKKPM